VTNPQSVLLTGRRLDPADDSHVGPARRLQPRAGVPADAGSGRPDPRLQRIHPTLGRRSVPSSCGCCCATSAWTVCAPDRISPRARAAFKRWIDESPDFERLAPVPFSTICFRYRPAALAATQDEPTVAADLDQLNIALMTHQPIRRGFLSHTRLRGDSRFASRSRTCVPRTPTWIGSGRSFAASRGLAAAPS